MAAPTVEFGDSSFSIHTGSIANARDIEQIESESGVHPIPDMFFGISRILIRSKRLTIEMNPLDAIKCCRTIADERHKLIWHTANAPTLTDEDVRSGLLQQLKIRQSQEWNASRSNPVVREVDSNHDWTFTTSYWGDARYDGVSSASTEVRGSECSDAFLPLSTLMDTSLKVLMFKEVEFWEDELGDNGYSRMGVKLRVMESFFYLLMKFELKVDGVLESRSIETRIYHEFSSNEVRREFKWIENGVEQRQLRVSQVMYIDR